MADDLADLSHVATDDEAVKIAIAKASLGPAKSVCFVLEALLARAKAAEHNLHCAQVGFNALQECLDDTRAHLDARIKALEGALAPFAKHGEWVDQHFPGDDNDVIGGGTSDSPITLGDYRRARDAVKG